MSIRVLLGILLPSVWLLNISRAKDELATSYDLWNTVVSTYITRGQLDGINVNVVDYEGIRRADEFYAYLNAIRDVDAKNFTRDEVYGFFMNVYNAFAIKMILEHSCVRSSADCKPIESIRDIGTILNPVWLMKAGYAAGKSWSLDEVENYLRNPKPFKEDPRVHACIVCASISCPDVRTTAYHPLTIDDQMGDQIKRFLQNDKKGQHYGGKVDLVSNHLGLLLDQFNKTIFLSHIFKWFEGDFISNSGGVRNFVMQFAPSEVVRYMESNNVTFQYFDYNWDLNGQVKCNCTI